MYVMIFHLIMGVGISSRGRTESIGTVKRWATSTHFETIKFLKVRTPPLHSRTLYSRTLYSIMMYTRALWLSRPLIGLQNRAAIVSSRTLSACSTVSSDGEAFRKLHDIQLKGLDDINDFEPITSFNSAPFKTGIVESLKRQGFTEPTTIQAQSWPIAIAGRDIISIARTGSGKTCAFLLPCFEKLSRLPPQRNQRGEPRKYPTAVVLAPTRELALQIENEANKFAPSMGLNVACFCGGTAKGPQFRAISRGIDLIVGTPGRLNDLIETGALDLKMVKYLVLVRVCQWCTMCIISHMCALYSVPQMRYIGRG